MKRMFLVVPFLALCLAGQGFSQQVWERTYGGLSMETARSVQQTTDGGYIVVGFTGTYGDSDDVYLIKTDANGDTLWTRTYGLVNGVSVDYGYSVQQTTDGGYIIAGDSDIGGVGTGQVYLIKTDASGDTLWSRTYGGPDDDGAYSVQQTTDGGYVIAGFINAASSQVYLVKTDATGVASWTQNYGGTGSEAGYSVRQTTDGGYIVAGYTTSFGNGIQAYLVKTNASGTLTWQRNYGGASSDYARSVQQTTDGGYIVAGQSNSFGNSYQHYLIKTNATGDTLWTRTYGGTGREDANSVRQTTDGGYIVAGYSEAFGNGRQAHVFKTNASGALTSEKNYGGTNSDYGYSVQQTTDGGYVVAGVAFVSGLSDQAYLIKDVGISGVETPVGQLDGLPVGQLKARPNPFTSFATVPGQEAERFNLYDISGRKVGTYNGDRIGEGLSPGVYFLRPEGKNARPLRIVKVR